MLVSVDEFLENLFREPSEDEIKATRILHSIMGEEGLLEMPEQMSMLYYFCGIEPELIAKNVSVLSTPLDAITTLIMH